MCRNNDLSVPKDEACDKNEKCKKCSNKVTSNDISMQQKKENIADSMPSTSGISKPYTFRRSKVNFTIEDLENSSEDDEFLPMSMYL